MDKVKFKREQDRLQESIRAGGIEGAMAAIGIATAHLLSTDNDELLEAALRAAIDTLTMNKGRGHGTAH